MTEKNSVIRTEENSVLQKELLYVRTTEENSVLQN